LNVRSIIRGRSEVDFGTRGNNALSRAGVRFPKEKFRYLERGYEKKREGW